MSARPLVLAGLLAFPVFLGGGCTCSQSSAGSGSRSADAAGATIADGAVVAPSSSADSSATTVGVEADPLIQGELHLSYRRADDPEHGNGMYYVYFRGDKVRWEEQEQQGPPSYAIYVRSEDRIYNVSSVDKLVTVTPAHSTETPLPEFAMKKTGLTRTLIGISCDEWQITDPRSP